MLTTFQKAVLATLGLGALLVALAITARGGASASPPTLVLPGTNGGPVPGIYTSGDATVKVRPDLAVITVGVTAQAPTAADAQSQVAQRVARILERAKVLGVADKDTKSGSYSIQPQYAYDKGVAPKITGYQATQQIVLSYRKVDDAGRALDTLVQNDGATNASLSFALEDPKAAQTDARRQAIGDARAKAQAMADAAGVRLGTVLSVSDQSTPVGPILQKDATGFAQAPAAAPTQIPVSDLDIVIHVMVQFSIG